MLGTAFRKGAPASLMALVLAAPAADELAGADDLDVSEGGRWRA